MKTESTDSSGLVLLLDLAGDDQAARAWLEAIFPTAEIRALDKAALKWESKLQALKRIRRLNPAVFAVFTEDLSSQASRRAILLFGALAGARRIVIGERSGQTISRSRPATLLTEAPLLALERLLGSLAIVPFSWLATFPLDAALACRRIVRENRVAAVRSADRSSGDSILYVRATLSSAVEGGMASHLKGFLGGAQSLGHHVLLLLSGRGTGARPSAGIAAGPAIRVEHLAPSNSISATKALFEIWNNITFTISALSAVRGNAGTATDFIYQRYSRFNCTGVLLSILSGLPLALEFNGSEVWISQQWDPVGHLKLLRRIERLNLKAADMIFTVSEVERQNLIASGIDPGKIMSNPNGVDPERFHPDCSGEQVRRALRIEDKTVVGFLGTFGPWHGAPTLAEAACQVPEGARCHFLFIGDGDQRPKTESIFHAAGKSGLATFLGRLSHRDVPAYLAACDILVSPQAPASDGSEFFGSPTKLFEYLAMGRAVIASRLGQIGEVIVDGQNGMLVQPGEWAPLAQAIERLALAPAMRKQLGEQARRTVLERFTWRHNAARVFDEMSRFRVNRR